MVCALAGTAEKPIIVRQVPGERATINGGFEQGGAHTWMWGFEITNTDQQRSGGEQGRPAVTVSGTGSRMINVIMHDVGHAAPGVWNSVGEIAELHGVLLWANGHYPKGTYPAGSMYVQCNQGRREISDVIAFRNFTSGLFAGSSGGGSRMDNIRFEGNISFDNPQWNLFLQAGKFPMKGNAVVNNCFWSRRDDRHKACVQLSYYDLDNESVEVRDNYIVLGPGDGSQRELYLKRWQGVTFTGNTVVGPGTLAWFEPSQAPTTDRTWDNNRYFGGSAQPFKFGGAAADFEGWRKASGFDAGGTWSREYPTGVKVFVRPNKYEPGRGHVAVYNWDKLPAVPADVSSILKPGDVYEVRDAQNYFGKPVIEGRYDGKPLSMPMNLTEVARPVGEVPHIQGRFTHTAPEFAAFVVVRKGG